MNELPPREPGERLRPLEELKIVEMAQTGATQEQIAAMVKCDQSTVSRTVAKYQDTRPLARKRLESEALNMVERLVTDAKPETILKVLAKLDVVRDDGDVGGGGDTNNYLVIGSGGVPLGDWRAGDRIGVMPGPQFANGEPSGSLVVERGCYDGAKGGLASYQAFELPCAVSDIPTWVKWTPAAAELVKALQSRTVEGEVVTNGDCGGEGC
jgi:hypothetical protein